MTFVTRFVVSRLTREVVEESPDHFRERRSITLRPLGHYGWTCVGPADANEVNLTCDDPKAWGDIDLMAMVNLDAMALQVYRREADADKVLRIVPNSSAETGAPEPA